MCILTCLAAVLTLTIINPAVQASALSSVSASGQAKQLTAENAEAFLQQFFNSEEVQAQLSGAVVSIVKDGKIVAKEGFGYADKSLETEADPVQTVFRMASVTKTFTAVAVMQLVEQGKVDLNADFQIYTGPMNFENPFNTPVTVEHLLTHTSGFLTSDSRLEMISYDFENKMTIEDYVHQHMPSVVREPGTSYMYDNFASLLLGLVVEKVSGERFEDYMNKHIFNPLNMNKSGFMLEGPLKKDLATAYNAAGDPLDLYTVQPTVMPHGGMLSTANDIGMFMNAFLNGGTGNARILAESSVEAMQEYRSAIHPNIPDTTYGFEAPFQFPGAGSSPEILTKAGDLMGFSSYMFLMPEQKTGVFIAYNQTSGLRNMFYPAFIQTFFPQYATPAAFNPFEPQNGADLEPFTGYYTDLRLKNFVSTVTVKENTLTINDAYLGMRELKQIDDNLFVDELTGYFTGFERDDTGKVTYLKEANLNPLAYEQKGLDTAGYLDVTKAHPYAEPIMMLQSLGYYPNDPSLSFKPDAGITRSEYVRLTLECSGLSGSKTVKMAFADIEGHPNAAYIQAAIELGMITGTADGKFQPDRVISRQEAAVIQWRLIRQLYPDELFQDVQLAGQTDEWALPAVRMAVALGWHGPDIKKEADGSVDFKSKEILSNKENAAILYSLLTKPIGQIVSELAGGDRIRR
ncbi:penicillin-binding protein [Paenibacillus sp. FSL R7-0273]|nr:penicillin-binding protein [Paenibacillus sp. FSL R7-0273]